MKKLKFLALPFLLAACSSSPQIYQAETPKMDFMNYFAGTTYGYGAIYSRSGQVTDRVIATIKATPATNARGESTLRALGEYHYASGKTQKTDELYTRHANGDISIQSKDMPGVATGVESGNAIRFTYPFIVHRDNGKTITVSAEDWMWRINADVVQNRNSLSKFGFKVAELVMSFTKQPPAR